MKVIICVQFYNIVHLDSIRITTRELNLLTMNR